MKMTSLTVLHTPEAEPLSLAGARDFLRIGAGDEDALLADLIRSARAEVESASGLALVTRTLRRRWAEWPHGLIRGGVRLRPAPARALMAVSRIDAAGADDSVTERFRLEGGRLRLRPDMALPVIPLGGAVHVDFEAGFGPPDAVPEDLIQAVRLTLLAAYQRGQAGGLPEAAAALVAARREVRL
jgi:uncharacterized phiE125 gp8 family phage protein